VIVGGIGARKTPALAARFADEFNYPFPHSVEAAAAQFDRVRAACTQAGRDPESLRYSAALILCCGRDDAQVKRRAEAIRHDADALRGAHLVGTVAEVVDIIGRYAELGAVRLYAQTLDLSDLEHLELLAGEVAPQVR
jgi:alkanesulfonate monooxygenase SsuD/methylene tetrahydromethanopterin reductase-like flavin-dependent oxidoreductase (luciferase family)